jgi:hypothetical protein
MRTTVIRVVVCKDFPKADAFARSFAQPERSIDPMTFDRRRRDYVRKYVERGLEYTRFTMCRNDAHDSRLNKSKHQDQIYRLSAASKRPSKREIALSARS